MPSYDLSHDEAVLVADVLMIWREGLEPCRTLLDHDPAVESLEELVALSGGLSEQQTLIDSVVRKLKGDHG